MTEDKSTGAPGNEKMKEFLAAQPEHKPTLIKVSAEFTVNGRGLWLGIEIPPMPGVNVVSEYVAAHETLKEAFKAISGQTMTDYNTGVPSSTPPIIDYRAKERVEILIDNAQALGELRGYYGDAVKYGLEDYYENRIKELS